jgi:hypothetical protein
VNALCCLGHIFASDPPFSIYGLLFTALWGADFAARWWRPEGLATALRHNPAWGMFSFYIIMFFFYS